MLSAVRQTLAPRLAPRHIPYMRPLTVKQRAFCREFVKDENRRQAAISAGYREEAASERAGKLLQDSRLGFDCTFGELGL